MPDLMLYLLKANVALVLFFLAYHLVLRKLTFYHLNRLFLVFGIVFSAVYPLVDLSELFSQHEELAAVQSYAVVLPVWAPPAIPEQAAAFDYWFIPVALFWVGCAFMAARLLLQFLSLYRIHRASVPASYQGVGFRKVQGISEAFSFWKTIYLNPTQHRSPELEAILRHEQIHVKGWHTLDVLLAELSTVFYWFNPGVWLMKQAMKENLEFIADQHVVDAGVDRKEYQYLLLKVVGATQPQIANQFNFPSLKRRIAMMNKMPTSRANRLRLLVVMPLVAVLLVAFRSASQDDIATITETVFPEEVITQTPNQAAEDLDVFFKRNPDVQSVHWVANYSTANYGSDSHEVKRLVVARYKVVQSYRLDQESDMAKAANEYGELPKTPAKPTSFENPYFEVAQQQGKTDEYAAFYARNPEVKQIYWRSNARIVVALKSGSEDVYTFGDKKSMAAAEKKYGKLPSTPLVAKRDMATQSSSQDESYIIKLQDMDYYQDKAKWPEDYKDFLKRHPNVKDVGWKFDNRRDYNLESIVIYLKNGKTETYDYNRNPRIPAAEAKWGKLPFLPPPPPPVKPETPDTPPADELLPAPPPPLPADIPVYIPAPDNRHEDYKAFLKRNQDVKEVGWMIGKKDNRNLRLIILYLNGGETDVYDLNNDQSIAAAEKKYGELPGLPPPPPPVRKQN